MADTAASTFDALRTALAADPSLGAKVKGKLCFDLGDSMWLVDAVAGEITKRAPTGDVPAADCTVKMSEKDFVALAAGKLSGMSAYMTGKMKIQGKVGLAQKFGDLAAAARKAKPKAKPPATATATAAAPAASTGDAAPSPPPPKGFGSNAVFAKIAANMKANPALLKKVDGSFLFKLSGGPAGATASWVVDASSKSATGGQVAPSESLVAKPDCTIAISDEHLVALAAGKLSPMSAYMTGKLKLSGKAALAQKLAALLADGKPKAKL